MGVPALGLCLRFPQGRFLSLRSCLHVFLLCKCVEFWQELFSALCVASFLMWLVLLCQRILAFQGWRLWTNPSSVLSRSVLGFGWALCLWRIPTCGSLWSIFGFRTSKRELGCMPSSLTLGKGLGGWVTVLFSCWMEFTSEICLPRKFWRQIPLPDSLQVYSVFLFL